MSKQYHATMNIVIVILMSECLALFGCEASAGVLCSVLGHYKSRRMWIKWKDSRKKMRIIRGYASKWDCWVMSFLI